MLGRADLYGPQVMQLHEGVGQGNIGERLSEGSGHVCRRMHTQSNALGLISFLSMQSTHAKIWIVFITSLDWHQNKNHDV